MRYVPLVLLLLFVTNSAIATELEDRERITASAFALLLEEDFEALTRMAREYRSSGGRTSSGIWALTIFHQAVGRPGGPSTRERGYWDELEGKARRWAERYSAEPAAHICRAQLALSRAWAIRGRKYAKEVDPKDWNSFREAVEVAGRILMQQKQIASADPHWYAVMIEVAMLQSWDGNRFAELALEGLSKHPDYYPTYFSITRKLEPKWGGSGEAIESFANAAVDRTRGTEGMGMYARIYWYASSDQYGDDLFSQSKIDWPRMRSGIEDVLAHYPDQWNIQNFARFSCLAGDLALTKDLLERVESDPMPQVWLGPWEFQTCREQSTVTMSASTPPETKPPPLTCPKDALEKSSQRPMTQRSGTPGEPPIMSERRCVVHRSGRDLRHGPYLAFDVDGHWLQQGQYETGDGARNYDRKVGEWHHRKPGTCGDWIEWTVPHFRNAEEARARRKPSPVNVAMNSENARCPAGLRSLGRVDGAVGSKSCELDGLSEGPAWIWYEDGETRFEKHYVTGILAGPFRAYHSNGALRWEGAFDGGLEEGRWKLFDCDGELLCEGRAKAGHIAAGWECREGTAPPLRGWVEEIARQ